MQNVLAHMQRIGAVFSQFPDLHELIRESGADGLIDPCSSEVYAVPPRWVSTSAYQRLWTGDVIRTRLDAMGYKCIGAGHFSLVFAHDDDAPGVVFKISLREFDAYAAYAMHVRQIGGGDHLPVIYEIGRVGEYTVYALEGYFPADQYMDWCELCDTVDNMRELPNSARGSLYDTVRRIAAHFKGVARLDLHIGNVMWCERRGQLIITDPVSFTKEFDNGAPNQEATSY